MDVVEWLLTVKLIKISDQKEGMLDHIDNILGDKRNIDKLFSFYDADNLGCIDKEELAIYMEFVFHEYKNIGCGKRCWMAETEINELMSVVDQDGNRKLDREEFDILVS
jgi:Ca2+-binding EF-hand superfamily protein